VNPARIHHVEFCSRLYDFTSTKLIAAESEFCERHNCADDECAE